MEDRLARLRPEERRACLIAKRVLGAAADPWDVDGRQGAVDAMLTLGDGLKAAFEITALAATDGHQTNSLLWRDGNEWPSPGQWWWTVQVGSVADLPRLREAYVTIALLCEAEGVSRPMDLWRRSKEVHREVRWLVEESLSACGVTPRRRRWRANKSARPMVVPSGRGGGVDRSLAGLRPALEDAFAQPQMARHLTKVASAEADEHHLYVIAHRSALPFAVADGLWVGTTLPPDAPPLPEGVSHLWLAPGLGSRVLLWSPHGWQDYRPYD